MDNKIELQKRVEKLANYFKNDTSNKSLALNIADTYIQLNELENAKSILDKTLETCVGDFEADPLLFKKSTILLAQQKPSEAIEVLESISEQNTSEPAIQINKAYAYFQLAEFEKALSILERLNSLSDPSLAVLHARTLYYLGQIEEGVVLLKDAASNFPEHSEVQGLLSLMLLDLGKLDDNTFAYAESSLKQNPNQIEALLTTGMIQQHHFKNLKKADTYFDKAISTNPYVGRGWLYKGLSLMLTERIKEAQKYLSKACELMPEHIGSWHSMGWSHLLLSELKDAENCFSTAMELDRNFSESHGGLAVVQALLGNRDEAEQHAKVALRLNNQCFSAKYAQLILASPENSAETTQKILKEVFSTEQGKEAEDFLKLLQNNKTR